MTNVPGSGVVLLVPKVVTSAPVSGAEAANVGEAVGPNRVHTGVVGFVEAVARSIGNIVLRVDYDLQNQVAVVGVIGERRKTERVSMRS